MGSILIGVFLAGLSRKVFRKKTPGFSAFLVTFFTFLGLITGLVFPFTYGNSEILKSNELTPLEGSNKCIEVIDTKYRYRFLTESGVSVETTIDSVYEDIRVSSDCPKYLNYCIEYPSTSFMSFAILKTPRHYYEFT